jgi:hypothetical protein
MPATFCLKPVIPVLLNVPNRIFRGGSIPLVAFHLDLAESPLRQIHSVFGSQQAFQYMMTQQEPGCKRSKGTVHWIVGVFVHNFDNPLVVQVAMGEVAIGTHFPLSNRDKGLDWVAVKLSLGLVVQQTDDVAVTNDLDFAFRLVLESGFMNFQLLLVSL